MSAYVLKIVGVVFISIIIDVILPNGKMEKYVKSTMALIIVFVIISPLPTLIKNMKNYKFNLNDDLIDYEFVQKMNLKKIDNVEETIKQALKEQGIEGVDIEIISDLSKDETVYLFVNINLANVVLKGQATSINLKEKIQTTILQYISIEKENILFYE